MYTKGHFSTALSDKMSSNIRRLSGNRNFFSDFGRLPGEAGYALITVMVISLMISVITMSMVFSVHRKITLAQEVKDRTRACLCSTSAFNEILYNILTSTLTRTSLEIHQDGGIIKRWNIYGDPIKFSPEVTVRLRDTAGMLSLPFGSRFLRILMMAAVKDSKEVNAFIDTFADWQDRDKLKRLNGAEAFSYRAGGYPYTPRNFYIQTPGELKLLYGFNRKLPAEVEDEFVYWGGAETNYLTMSEKLLKALLQDDLLADRIIKLRRDGRLTAYLFQDITGIKPQEPGFFRCSGWLKIELTARVGKAVDRIAAVVAKKQLRRQPFILAEWKK